MKVSFMKSKLPSLFSRLTEEHRKKLKKASFPSFVEPMLATLTDDYFSSNQWMYEHKFDGERCLAFKHNGKVRLMTRNKHVMNAEYPELVTAFNKQNADNFVVDGEIVAVAKAGVSDFQLLQGRIHLQREEVIKEKMGKIHICLRIFDVMHIDGYDVRKLPLIERKKILKKLLSYNKILTFTEHKIGNGLVYFKKACKLGWEGLIAKRSASEYVGVRSKDWLKFKCIMKQELVIAGYTEPQKSRKYFGALLVGYYAKGKLRYAGKVGTGYTQDVLEMLGKKMKRLEIKTCPFVDYDEPLRGVHWVKPELVAEFQFAQWTNDGKLRVGRYKGLRDDKAAKEVVKETPKAIGPGKRL